MFNIRRKLFSQNFLHSRKLVARLVGSSSLTKNDLVLEIGPGKGIITEQLVQHAGHVVAVEIDRHWADYLQNLFQHVTNLTIQHQDFLLADLPHYPYKVFANIPFAIEGKIIRKLLDAAFPPLDTYLVMMEDAACRFASPKPSYFSLLYAPWFRFEIVHRFRRTDFEPVPKVDSVLVRIEQKSHPVLPMSARKNYTKFLEAAFGKRPMVYKNVMQVYGKMTIDKAFQELSLRKNSRAGEISQKQWILLFIKICGHSW